MLLGHFYGQAGDLPGAQSWAKPMLGSRPSHPPTDATRCSLAGRQIRSYRLTSRVQDAGMSSRRSRCEVQMEASMLSEPALDRGRFVPPAVVRGHINVEILAHARIDGAEKL